MVWKLVLMKGSLPSFAARCSRLYAMTDAKDEWMHELFSR